MSILIESSDELKPWLVIQGKPPDTSVALWKIQEKECLSLAIFSNRELAESYAENCNGPSCVQQFDSMRLIQVLIDCYRGGVQYAALNPTSSQVQQVFVLRQVLRAAKARYGKFGE